MNVKIRRTTTNVSFRQSPLGRYDIMSSNSPCSPPSVSRRGLLRTDLRQWGPLSDVRGEEPGPVCSIRQPIPAQQRPPGPPIGQRRPPSAVIGQQTGYYWPPRKWQDTYYTDPFNNDMKITCEWRCIVCKL